MDLELILVEAMSIISMKLIRILKKRMISIVLILVIEKY